MMMRIISKPFVYILFILILLSVSSVHSQNFLTNGGFESGGSGNGFLVTSPYSLATTPGTSIQGNYSFVNNPNAMNATFIIGGDHTTGTGKMMVVHGSTTPGLNFFWSTGNTGGAIPGFVIGQSYIFSYWIKSVSNTVTNPVTQANIAFSTGVGDISNVIPSTLNSYAPLPAQGWQKVSYTFTADDVNILIQLSNINISPIGNDFAIDDMSITCASPPILSITNPATVCSPSTVNLTLAAVTAGSDSGTLSYYTDAAATISLSIPSASVIATSGTYYIKNTAPLGCETVQPVLVTIAPAVASPFFTTPINLCLTAPTALIATPSPGYTLKWYGTAATGGTASSIATIPSATGTYFVSQTNGVCESGRVAIQANLVADNGATILNLKCDASQILAADKNSSVYFDWSPNPAIPNSYNYSYTVQGRPAVTGNTTPTHLQVFGMLPGQSVEMTLTSALRPCVPAQTITCMVPCPLPLLKPNFPPITKKYCVGNTIPNFSNTSPNFISGTWSPSNVISNATSGNYTFTPDPILFPCAETQDLFVTVIPLSTPTFGTLPTSVCENATAPLLPLISTNTIPITGAWDQSINTSILGPKTYTFVPDAGQCVSSLPTSVVITVNSSATPTFNTIPAICAGTTPIPTLPTTSIEGISGVWNPTAISNTATGNYQFIPNISLYPCAPTPPPLTVTVTPNVTPTFAVSDTQCEGTSIVTLPNSSTNTPPITGTWDINTIDTSIVAVNPRVFTTTNGSCVISSTISKTITVYSSAMPTFSSVPDFCSGTPSPPFPVSNEGITGAWLPNTISNAPGTKQYQFTPDKNIFPCAPIPPPLSVTVLPSATPTFLPSVPTDVCENATLPNLPTASNDSPPITGYWSTLTVDPITTIDTSIVGTGSYTFTPDSGQCAISPSPIAITVNPTNSLSSVSWTVTGAFSDNQTIEVTALSAGDYLYQLDSGPLQTSPIFENVSSGIHTIIVSDANGCSASITENDIIVMNYPKFFTPNSDGFNDAWKIADLSGLISKIYIFDRYGKLLKEISPDGLGWDGTYLGKQMPADDYWFTVDYIESFIPKKFKSHFSLKR